LELLDGSLLLEGVCATLVSASLSLVVFPLKMSSALTRFMAVCADSKEYHGAHSKR
jgi:hypothetical protein